MPGPGLISSCHRFFDRLLTCFATEQEHEQGHEQAVTVRQPVPFLLTIFQRTHPYRYGGYLRKPSFCLVIWQDKVFGYDAMFVYRELYLASY